jgi:hypothetical protein
MQNPNVQKRRPSKSRKIINWEHIKSLHVLQETSDNWSSEKLTREYIESAKSKMKVKFTVQVMIEITANSIKHCC